jgi:uncharacterized protein YbjT (DUF2867 family)
MDGQTILVTGATGRQGGSVVDALLGTGATVRGLTRDPASERARRLADRGVEVVEGDLARRRDLRRAMAGADGVFLVTDYWSAGRAGEIRHGRNAVRAAREAGVERVVFSSVASADRAPNVEHFRSKAAIEAYLRKVFPTATVLRPTYFTSNFESQRAGIAEGRLALPIGRYTQLALLDPVDLGRVAARAFADPDRFAGRTLELAGDAVTLREAAATFQRVLGHTVEAEYVRPADARERLSEDVVAMYEWLDRVGYDVSPRRAEAETGLELTSLASYLTREWTDGDGGVDADGSVDAGSGAASA